MRTLRLKIADLIEFEGTPPSAALPNPAAITSLALKQFSFLPQPVSVLVEGDEVVIQFLEESAAAQTEAARLAERAGKRAAEGNYEKAIGILKRALELQPSLHPARRDLAMAYVEVGDVDNATNHLIEVLRLNPRDAWSWVVLANLYIREKSDQDTGEKFLRKALEIAPTDAWALNSLATVTHQQGRSDEAIKLFERAIDAMTPEQVRDVAYEIALLGRNGLDYAAPDEKYELRALPDRKFSGLHLMCLMYAGFKRVAPEHEVQMDLDDPFLKALQMHKNGEGKH